MGDNNILVLLYSIKKMLLSCLFLNAFTYSFDKRNWLHVFNTELYDSFLE